MSRECYALPDDCVVPGPGRAFEKADQEAEAIYLLIVCGSGQAACEDSPDDLYVVRRIRSLRGTDIKGAHLTKRQPPGRAKVGDDDTGRIEHDHVANTARVSRFHWHGNEKVLLEVSGEVIQFVSVEVQILLHAGDVRIALQGYQH